MGAGNVKLVYARWYGLPDLPFRVLAYMALVSLDDDREPVYWGGWESLALAAGRLVPPRDDDNPETVRVRRAALKAVNVSLRLLVERRALRVARPAAPGRNTHYGLTLTAPTVHGDREPNGARSPGTDPAKASTGTGTNGARSPVPTVHGEPTNGARSADVTVHAHRAPEEYEEQPTTQPMSEMAEVRTAVTATRAREAEQTPIDSPKCEHGCAKGWLLVGDQIQRCPCHANVIPFPTDRAKEATA